MVSVLFVFPFLFIFIPVLSCRLFVFLFSLLLSHDHDLQKPPPDCVPFILSLKNARALPPKKKKKKKKSISMSQLRYELAQPFVMNKIIIHRLEKKSVAGTESQTLHCPKDSPLTNWVGLVFWLSRLVGCP
jgi:hypothetical protein